MQGVAEKPQSGKGKPVPQTLPADFFEQPKQEAPAQPTAQTTAAAPPAKGGDQRLPRHLAAAKPRYNYGAKAFDLDFESDVDKAAYIAAQKTPSKRDAEYVQHVQKATGLSEESVRSRGAAIREQIKGLARDAEPGTLRVHRMDGDGKAKRWLLTVNDKPPSTEELHGGPEGSKERVTPTTATPGGNPSMPSEKVLGKQEPGRPVAAQTDEPAPNAKTPAAIRAAKIKELRAGGMTYKEAVAKVDAAPEVSRHGPVLRQFEGNR